MYGMVWGHRWCYSSFPRLSRNGNVFVFFCYLGVIHSFSDMLMSLSSVKFV